MKKILLPMVTMMLSQVAMASSFFCGANIETSPGNQVYDKLVFSEIVDGSQVIQRYVLPDGRILRSEDMTAEKYAQLVNGTLVIGINFQGGKASLYSARVLNTATGIKHENLAMALSFEGVSSLLIANGASLSCKSL